MRKKEQHETRPRPLRVILKKQKTKDDILRKLANVRQVTTYKYNPKTIFVVQDQTKLVRESDISLRAKLEKPGKKPKRQIQNKKRKNHKLLFMPPPPILHSTILKNYKETLPLKYIHSTQCLRNKFIQLDVLISEEYQDITAITETWFS